MPAINCMTTQTVFVGVVEYIMYDIKAYMYLCMFGLSVDKNTCI